MSTLICDGCNRTNHIPGDKFCFKCGTPLREAPKTCGCGRLLQFVDDYCPSCGVKWELKKEEVKP